MERAKICVQAMTIKKAFAELGPYEALKKMAELGYHGVELSQVDMGADSVAEMKRACEEFDIEVAAISGGLDPRKEGDDALTVNLDKFVQDCKTLGAKYIRIGMMPVNYMASVETLKDFCRKAEDIAEKLKKEGIHLYYHNHHVEFQKVEGMPVNYMASVETLKDFCRKAEDIAEKLKKEGIHLYYHNHHVEFQKVEGRYVIDLVKEWAPNVGVELDVHWVQRGGENPVNVIPRLAGSLDLLHLKDYKVYPYGEALEKSEDDENLMREYFKDCVHFAEVGEGNLDMKAIIEAGLKAGSKYLIVEQDDTYDRDPYESLKISAENLKKMGYGDCF